MFDNEKVQDKLLSPIRSLDRKKLFENYNKKEYVFSKYDLKQLENFLHTIKSPKIYEQLIESKYFQRIIALCHENQLEKSFFRNIDEVKLFNNIINDAEIFETRLSRKRNIIKIFNNVSNHILLPDNYDKIISNTNEFIRNKKWNFREYEKVYIDQRTLSLLSHGMIGQLLEFENIDKESVKNFLKTDIILKIKENNCDFNKIFKQ